MRNKIINMLKNAENYLSGEDMSHELGISRAAIWKHIKKLKAEGYEIVSVTKKGYKLENSPDNISPEAIKVLLNTKRNIEYCEETDSTNEQAKRNSSMPDGTLFISEKQTAGKGRLGRNWESPKGSGIWMSLLLKPDILPQNIPEVTLIAGIAVCRALGNNSKIKWPNDVIIGSRKVCGILTEMSAEIDRVDHIICGIGINVNTPDFPTELAEKATSLFIETGKEHNRCEIIAAVMNEFEPLYRAFLENGFSSLKNEYKSLCATLGRDVRVIYRNKELTGNAVDIDDNGGLIINTPDGDVTVTSGEVSVRGIYGYI